MNLLIDQREDSGEKSQDWTTPIMDEQPSPIEESTSAPAAEAPLDYYQFDDSESRKRSILGPVVVILVLLSAIVAAAYYGFFYKSQDLSGLIPSTTQTIPQTESDNTRAETATSQTPATLTAPQETTPEPQIQAPPKAREETPPIVIAGAAEGPLYTAMQLITTVMDALPEEVKLTTLIMDESSFSAEVSSSGRAGIENYFAALQAKVPGQLSFSPSSGYYTGVRALINGSFADLNSAAGIKTGERDLNVIKKELGRLAIENSFAAPEISYGKPISRADRQFIPIFIKVIGPEHNFEAYGRAIAQLYPHLVLNKIIVMLKPAQQVTGVFRLEMADE